jgi:hypothetical protein
MALGYLVVPLILHHKTFSEVCRMWSLHMRRLHQVALVGISYQGCCLTRAEQTFRLMPSAFNFYAILYFGRTQLQQKIWENCPWSLCLEHYKCTTHASRLTELLVVRLWGACLQLLCSFAPIFAGKHQILVSTLLWLERWRLAMSEDG